MSDFGRPRWRTAPEIAGALPPCLCAGTLRLDEAGRSGGCVRVHRDWILTAHHVIDVPDLARRATARFNDFEADPGRRPVEYRLDPDRGYFPSRDGVLSRSGRTFDLDYVFVALAGPARRGDPSMRNRARATATASVGGRAFIPRSGGDYGRLRFPEERLDEYPQGGRLAHADGRYLYYQVSTDIGVSGMPVFDANWRVVGLHTASRRAGDRERPRRKDYNCGTLMAAILEDVRTNHAGFPDIVTLAD